MHYRLYRLHRNSGRIVSGDDIQADDDVTAIALADELSPGTPYELWCGTRKLLPARPHPADD